jgi:hypothetical protein
LRVGEDINEFVVRQEIETREGFPLGLHIVFQSFLYVFKLSVIVLQLLQ